MNSFQKVYERLYFPFFETHVKKRDTAQNYVKSLQTQWLSQKELLAKQVASLKILLSHAEHYCPYYRQLFSDYGFKPNDITSVSCLHKLPLLTKEIIIAHYESIISCQHKDTVWKKSTGGSTGQPLHFAYTKESYEWRVAMSKRGYAWAGASPGAKQAYIWGIQLGKIGHIKSLKERLHHLIDRQLYFNCFDFDEKAMSQCLTELNRFKPVAIIGYTNPLYNLALFIGENTKIKFAPQGVICASEVLYPYQREVIERVFGAKVFNTYGSREFMLIAAECDKHEGLHISAENLIVEIIKDDGTTAKDGETGKIVVTDLHNYGMPFIRYEIGDLGIATDRYCSCGRGLPLIADIVGRTMDMVRTPEGKIVPGIFFPHLFKDFPDVLKFQVTQEKLDYIIIKIVPSSAMTETTKSIIINEIRIAMGPTMVIDYEMVSDIPLTATGKYRVTVSKIYTN